MKDFFNYRYVLEHTRLPWIDYARGICIILVCYRHSFEGLINANFPTANYPVLELVNSSLVTFRMALFFIISGSFVARTLAKKSLLDFANDRFKIILYPMLVWGALQITLQLIFKNYTNAQRQPVDYLYLLVMPRKIEQFWYLNTLFMVGIFYAFLKTFLRFKLWQLMVTAILLYSLGAFFYSSNANMNYELLAFSFIPDLLHFFIFFFIGDAISSFIDNKDKIKYLSSLKLFVPIFILFLITHYYYTIVNLQNDKGYYVEFYMPISFLIIALSGCMLTIQLSFILQRFQVLKFLRVIGYHSLYIYLIHVMITGSLRIILSKVLHISNVPFILSVCVLSGILIPILLYNFLVRNGMWWWFSLKKPVDEIQYHSKLAVRR
ncbi:MAG: acyltransferase [Chitinophagaceae bacterium]